MKFKNVLDWMREKKWKSEKDNILEYKRYKIKIHLMTGEVLGEFNTARYYAITCSIGEYLLIKDSLKINNNVYPREAIKKIEEISYVSEPVYCNGVVEGFSYINGIREEVLRENQDKYRRIIDRYIEEEMEDYGREKCCRANC